MAVREGLRAGREGQLPEEKLPGADGDHRDPDDRKPERAPDELGRDRQDKDHRRRDRRDTAGRGRPGENRRLQQHLHEGRGHGRARRVHPDRQVHGPQRDRHADDRRADDRGAELHDHGDREELRREAAEHPRGTHQLPAGARDAGGLQYQPGEPGDGAAVHPRGDAGGLPGRDRDEPVGRPGDHRGLFLEERAERDPGPEERPAAGHERAPDPERHERVPHRG